jgi:hypothetical protein
MTLILNIRAKDLQRITGFSLNHCYLKLQAIRAANNKKPKQFITAAEVANFLGLEPETIIKTLETKK